MYRVIIFKWTVYTDRSYPQTWLQMALLCRSHPLGWLSCGVLTSLARSGESFCTPSPKHHCTTKTVWTVFSFLHGSCRINQSTNTFKSFELDLLNDWNTTPVPVLCQEGTTVRSMAHPREGRRWDPKMKLNWVEISNWVLGHLKRYQLFPEVLASDETHWDRNFSMAGWPALFRRMWNRWHLAVGLCQCSQFFWDFVFV